MCPETHSTFAEWTDEQANIQDHLSGNNVTNMWRPFNRIRSWHGGNLQRPILGLLGPYLGSGHCLRPWRQCHDKQHHCHDWAARQAPGILPEPSQRPQFRCKVGVRTKGTTKDLARRSPHRLSRTLRAHFKGLLHLPAWPEAFAARQLTGTRQTLAKYFGQIEATVQISVGTICFMQWNETWDQYFL